MEYRNHGGSDSQDIERLFTSVFSKAESDEEGVLIGKLANELMSTTDPQDLYSFIASDGNNVVGAIFFSRLTCQTDGDVFILAPVAVHENYQGQGVGQALIIHGLNALKSKGVRVIVTYGDPDFYGKVGFRPLSQEVIAAPLELSQPEGWLGKPLMDEEIAPIPGRCSCVEALNNPAYW